MKHILLGLILLPVTVLAASPKFDTVLYGASYYHEYMPYERLDKDVELMQQAGISVIRVGESTWSSFEPSEGDYQLGWIERVVDRMHKAGIRVVVGTPTYSVPPWLYRKHPEILIAPPTYGIRQNMDLSHPTYRWYAEKIIRKVVSHFAGHPAVIGFQVDNETHPNTSSAHSLHVSFVDYLKKKFGDTQTLNKIWGLSYWGQLVGDWDELPPREGIRNPGYKLEYERFRHKTVTDFLSWQAAIVNEYKRPDQFVTHDWPGGVRTNVDPWAVAKHLDIVSVNPYHPVQDRLDGQLISLSGDVTRSQKNTNYLVTETNAQTIGWNSQRQFPPYDGQIRLNVYSHVASGANMVAYWHWSSLHYGQETYWKGVLSHDLEPNRVYQEVSRVAHELKKFGPRLVNFEQHNSTAILLSADSHHAIQYMPFDEQVNYMTVLNQMYAALYQLNIGVDFLVPGDDNLADYKVILVPPLYVASDELLNKLADYVEGGGHIVMSFKSGFCNEHSTVRWQKAPGPLRKAAGFYYQEFSNLEAPLPLKGDPYQAGVEGNKVTAWAEMLIPETAETLASYDHHFFGKYPALTRNRHGKGTLTYQGTYLSDQLQERVLLQVLEMADLTGPDQKLPAPVKVKHGIGNSGKKTHYYFNYSADEQTFDYSYQQGKDLISGKDIAEAAGVTLGPWDLVIVEEN